MGIGDAVEITGALRIPPEAPYSFAAPDNSIEGYVEIRLTRGRLGWVRQYPIAVVP
ncbi:MAG: hypothetical protein HYY05_00975 [Chloroflexi bacterium]|nr:hypothetical protein [Chloroflexota bacterium]